MTNINVNFAEDTVTIDRNGFGTTVIFKGDNPEAVAHAVLSALTFNANTNFLVNDKTRKKLGL